MEGVLDGTTYLAVRDGVVKAALDAPALIVVDVTKLQAPSPSAWVVFTGARWLVVNWPDIPIGLVCSRAAGRRVMARNGITRYLPVYGNVDAATNAMEREAKPSRRRVREVWPAVPSVVVSARNFFSQWMPGPWKIWPQRPASSPRCS